jgi:multicomponent Na+:H+ antiporter subunit C
MTILGHYNYWVFIFLLAIGLYSALTNDNYVKRMIALGVFQAAVFLLFITMDKVEGGTGPIVLPDAPVDQIYANPLPQVLILTAIVVGIAVTALGLAIAIRIREEYGSVQEVDTRRLDEQA